MAAIFIALPNVQDEPRPWLARAVLLGARIVTAMVVALAPCWADSSPSLLNMSEIWDDISADLIDSIVNRTWNAWLDSLGAPGQRSVDVGIQTIVQDAPLSSVPLEKQPSIETTRSSGQDFVGQIHGPSIFINLIVISDKARDEESAMKFVFDGDESN